MGISEAILVVSILSVIVLLMGVGIWALCEEARITAKAADAAIYSMPAMVWRRKPEFAEGDRDGTGS